MSEQNTAVTTASAVTATTDATAPSAETFKTRFESLQERVTAAATTFGESVPVTGRLPEVQEAALLTMSDLKLAHGLFDTVQDTVNGIVCLDATEEDELGLVEMARQIADALMEQTGVAKEIIRPTIIKDLEQQLTMLETIVARIEANVAKLAV